LASLSPLSLLGTANYVIGVATRLDVRVSILGGEAIHLCVLSMLAQHCACCACCFHGKSLVEMLERCLLTICSTKVVLARGLLLVARSVQPPGMQG